MPMRCTAVVTHPTIVIMQMEHTAMAIIHPTITHPMMMSIHPMIMAIWMNEIMVTSQEWEMPI